MNRKSKQITTVILVLIISGCCPRNTISHTHEKVDNVETRRLSNLPVFDLVECRLPEFAYPIELQNYRHVTIRIDSTRIFTNDSCNKGRAFYTTSDSVMTITNHMTTLIYCIKPPTVPLNLEGEWVFERTINELIIADTLGRKYHFVKNDMGD